MCVTEFKSIDLYWKKIQVMLTNCLTSSIRIHLNWNRKIISLLLSWLLFALLFIKRKKPPDNKIFEYSILNYSLTVVYQVGVLKHYSILFFKVKGGTIRSFAKNLLKYNFLIETTNYVMTLLDTAFIQSSQMTQYTRQVFLLSPFTSRQKISWSIQQPLSLSFVASSDRVLWLLSTSSPLVMFQTPHSVCNGYIRLDISGLTLRPYAGRAHAPGIEL